MEKSKPNIILILTDQQRHDTCGCYGQDLVVTPNLDKLANEGIRFEHAFTNQPVCGPARSILQTGKYLTETGCYRNAIGLPIDNQNIADYFSNNGYETAYIGKWHHGNQEGTPGSAIRKGDYKLMEFFEDNHVELYDLRNDIEEENDISIKNPEITKELRTILENWRISLEAKIPEKNPDFKP